MADRSLSIRTIVEVFHVRIDDVPHRLSHPDRLSLAQTMRMEAVAPRLGELLQRVETVTLEEQLELSQLLDEQCRIVLDAPAAVHERLTDVDRLAVVQAFIQLRSTGQATGATETAPTAP